MIKPLANMNLVTISNQLAQASPGEYSTFQAMLPKPHQEWYRGNAKRRELNIVSYVNNFDIIIEISDNGVGNEQGTNKSFW